MRVGRFDSPKRSESRGGRTGANGSTVIKPIVRLETLRQIRFGKKLKAELTGDKMTEERAKVSLPQLRFMRELPKDWCK